jgi:serine/threonine-protein kinase
MPSDGITEVGKYRILEQIGEGAMGVVYRALDPMLNRPVAIKVMSDALARDDELRKRFLREAQAAGSLQHPNVVTVYDFGEVDGHLYIAMEFVTGEDLEAMLARRAPITVAQKIDIVVDVLNGLGYAHKRGIVHRDIKPANIRVDEEGRARIMDFGIAHLQSSKMTRTGLMVGTPAYMAPEQITSGTITPATDIFSIGAVLYELLTGTKPFEGESLQSVFYKIVSASPPDVSTVVPSLPASLNTITMHALEKDPAARFANAMQMANALTEVRATLERDPTHPRSISLQSVIATRLSTRPTEKIPVYKRNSGVFIAGGVAALVVIAGAIYVATRPSKPAEPTEQVAAQPTVTPPPAPQAVPSASPVPETNSAPTALTRASTPETGVPSKTTQTKAQPKSASPSSEELSLLRSLQSAAADQRRRASEAGATVDQLRAGDDQNTAAISATQQGKITEAAAHLNQATAAWTIAERDARAAAAAAASAAAAKTHVADVTPPKAAPTPPVTQSAPNPQPIVTQPVAAQPPPKVVVNPSVEIDAVVANYARAIDTRDIGEVRRAYPGATQQQLDGFGEFFKTLRTIRTHFSVGSLDIRGDAADAKLSGTYDYVTTSGKNEQQSVTFQASFRHDGGAWRLTSVR